MVENTDHTIILLIPIQNNYNFTLQGQLNQTIADVSAMHITTKHFGYKPFIYIMLSSADRLWTGLRPF